MPSLRSSIRRRLEAEEAEQDNSVEAKEAESNPVDPPDNAVETAAQTAIQTKLAEQPDPVLAQQPRYEEEDDDDELDDDVHDLELKAADASAQIAGHRPGTRQYADAVADRLRPQERDTPRRERGPSMMAPVTRSTPSWSSGRTTPSKTELTHEEVALAHQLGIDPETYRENKKKMHAMKLAGVIQE